MKPRLTRRSPFKTAFWIASVVFLMSGSLVFAVKASPASTYYYKFTVDRDGFTNSVITFSSTDSSGQSWVFVPRNASSWNYTVTSPNSRIVESEVVETDQLSGVQDFYFYRAFKFRYQSTGVFNMTIKFDFDNGAVIIEPTGIFYSPQIGFEPGSDGIAEVFFHYIFSVNERHAVATGSLNYPADQTERNRVLFNLQENIVRAQVEFTVDPSTPDYVTLKSVDNKTFSFRTPARYEDQARNVLRLYDNIYSNFSQSFNVTLDNIAVQFFLPSFDALLDVGGFVPYTGEQLGEININIIFIRGVNGTIEVIATHELVHRFLGKAGISPGSLLWFHEGMAQYMSVTTVLDLDFEGAKQERDNLEKGVSALIQELGGEDFGSLRLQSWTPSYQPADVGNLYLASYFVTSRLPQKVHLSGFDYYTKFFKLIKGQTVNNINVLALYLSEAANASVAVTLQNWGFTVADLYESPVSDLAQEASKSIEEVNPVFQPYKSLAEYLYQQALVNSERGNWERAKDLFGMSIAVANSAPLLTFLTIVGILLLLVIMLSRVR